VLGALADGRRRRPGVLSRLIAVQFRPAGVLEEITLGTIVLIVLILLLIGALPTWPHSRSWGYYPSGGLGLVMIIFVVLLLAGRF
jgi:hypothetical protein